MRIPSGTVDQVFYFVAVDSTDLATRETGLTTFTVYRSRDGAAAAAMTTPTVTEVDASNMPGVYKLLSDEDMTIGTGNDSEEMVFHITQASMAPVTRTIELYRPKITVGQELSVDTGGRGAADVERWLGSAVDTPASAGVPKVDVSHLRGSAQSAADLQDFADAGYDPATGKVQGVVLVDTLTTYTGNTVQTGDSYAVLVSASGTADSGSTTTVVDAARTELDTDYWVGSLIRFTTGNIIDQTAVITGFDAGTDTITFSPATTQAVVTHGYEIYPAASAITVGAIADSMYDESTVGHTTAGTFGYQLKTVLDARMAEASISTTGGAVDTVTTLTGHTAQTGDNYARLGAPAGSSVSADLADVPTVAEFNARTLVAASYFDPAVDAVASVTLVDTTTTNTDLVTAAAIRAEIDSNSTQLTLIVGDTNELQTDWKNGGRLDLILDIVAADTTTDIPALIAALKDLSAADVLTQINAALDTAIAELGVAAPTATPTLRTGLMLLYMRLRNKLDVQTSATDAVELHNDAGTQIASKLITDDGSDYSEAKMS